MPVKSLESFFDLKKGTDAPNFFAYLAIFLSLVDTITSLNYLGKMLTGSADTSQLGGPVKIAKITGQVAEYGVIPFFSIILEGLFC